MKRKYTKKSKKHFRKKSRKHFRKNKMKKTTKKFRKTGEGGSLKKASRARVEDVQKIYFYNTKGQNVRLYSYNKNNNGEFTDKEVPKRKETMEKTWFSTDGEFITHKHHRDLDKGDTLIEIREAGGRFTGNYFIPIDDIEYVGSNYD